MVKEIIKDKKSYYICEECDFAYIDKNIAKQCEDYCKKYKSCSIETTKKAIKI